ncbi:MULTISPECIES: hypothetical protein [Pseudomonas]|uniref:Ig-like domain-containing protein n=1 Tax=Pseudomonas entomophila TaxID=312306 RepID=A0A3Q8U3M1_9PSED|nr:MULTISPECIES: hypothetical protein [Pseudomonas]AZL70753.1 hypothetical protein EJA05_24805 [Pseudomonas oryziphila]UVL88711.1 hypothetical protein LOY51_23630 [Pseudomonas sichuanensis]
MNMSPTGPGIKAAAELYFTDLNDSPANPRLGIGYELLKSPIRLHAGMPITPRNGDSAILYWNNQQVDRIDINAENIDKPRLEFSVPTLYIQPPQGSVYYEYTDTDAGNTTPSLTRTIAVNTLVPGGPGPDLNPPFNDNLQACVVTPNPVTSLSASVTVQVPQWLNKEAGDELVVTWGSIPVAHPKVTNPNGGETVTIPVDVLMQAGTQPSLPVFYEIRDSVDNYSRLARPTQVPVQLPAPQVIANGSVVTQIDLNGLNQLEARISNYGMEQGDTVTVVWSGVVVRQKTEPVVVTGPLPIPLDLAWAQENKDRQVTVTYVVTRNGRTMSSSPVTLQVVEGDEGIFLPPPTVNDLQNGQLDYYWLLDNRGGEATIVVPAYTGMKPGHSVRVTWANNINWNTEAKTVGTIGPMEFKIRNTEIIDTIGGSANVNYTVVTATGAPPVASTHTVCRVKDNPPPFESMPPPTLQGLNLRIPKSGQTTWAVRVRWYHPESGWQQESPILHYGYNGQPYLDYTVPQAWVTANRGRLVYISYSMSVGTDRIRISRYLRYNVAAADQPVSTGISQGSDPATQALADSLLSMLQALKRWFNS